MNVKARSEGTPPIQAAEAFARLLAVAMAKKPELKVVNPAPRAELAKHGDLHKIAN